MVLLKTKGEPSLAYHLSLYPFSHALFCNSFCLITQMHFIQHSFVVVVVCFFIFVFETRFLYVTALTVLKLAL